MVQKWLTCLGCLLVDDTIILYSRQLRKITNEIKEPVEALGEKFTSLHCEFFVMSAIMCDCPRK